jgi:CheY-like chemotaxis protein
LARKILLADDSVTAQNMGRKILADAGYDVVTVNNGSAALKRIAEIKPDLIVLDVYMPGYSGLEVCQRLKDSADTAHIPVLLTVGKLEPFKPEEARRVKADAHIVKPFEASELLTAITKLEDRMVPQQSEGSRFSSSSSGVERFSGDGGSKKTEAAGESDSGWKSRLRFPSKKKKEEAEPEEVAADTNFGDTRKGKSKAGSFSIKPPAPAGQEPGLVPDIPRDITPEELDALSALVAKLDEPVEAVAAAVSEIEASKHAAEIVLAARQIDQPKSEKASEHAIETAPFAAAVVSAPAFAVEGKSEVEIPFERAEQATATLAANPDSGAQISEVEKPAVEKSVEVSSAASGDQSAISLPTVNTALLAEEPAPVERDDEPIFALALNTVVTQEAKVEEKIEDVKSVDAAATTETSESSETVAPEVKASRVSESAPEIKLEATSQKASEESASNHIGSQPVVAATSPAPTLAEEPVPSDAELAEALRMLTPETGSTESTTIPSHGTLVAAGQLLAEEAARNASGPRGWIAEAVAISPEEAALSLEDEMFRTFATTPAATPAATSSTTFATDSASASVIAAAAASLVSSEIEAGRITGVSAIAAAVENRLAEAVMAANSRVAAEHVAEQVKESPTTDAGSMPSSRAPQASAQEEKIAKIEPSNAAPEQSAASVRIAEPVASEESPSATFADAIGQDTGDKEVPQSDSGATAVSQADPPATVTTVLNAEAEENQNLSADSGDEESMGKSTWHQIRKTPTGAAASTNLVETAKQEAANQGSEEAPKAMAAAASAEGSSSSSFAAATDSSAIASIVDSVMADLRPKIVEEIAKKLAGK